MPGPDTSRQNNIACLGVYVRMRVNGRKIAFARIYVSLRNLCTVR